MVWPASWRVLSMLNAMSGGQSTRLLCPTDLHAPWSVPANMRQSMVPEALLEAGVCVEHLAPGEGGVRRVWGRQCCRWIGVRELHVTAAVAALEYSHWPGASVQRDSQAESRSLPWTVCSHCHLQSNVKQSPVTSPRVARRDSQAVPVTCPGQLHGSTVEQRPVTSLKTLHGTTVEQCIVT